MKKFFKLFGIAFFTACLITSYGCKKEVERPDLKTTDVSMITSRTATIGGIVTSDGGAEVTARGVCWGTDTHPTVNNNKTSDEPGTGSFISYLTGLDPGTTYYVRAYAKNSAGVAYGDELIFTTIPEQGSTVSKKANFPGGERFSAAGFSIGNKVYIGLGYNDGDWPLIDFWEWDQATNIWTRKADYPGNSAAPVVSFSIGTKGYIGTGQNYNTNGYTNEFWEYDPVTNSWTQKASLPTARARASAVGFSIGTKGYIGLGYMDSYTVGGNPGPYHDFWEWDQATNIWTEKASFGGTIRTEAVGFSIGNKGYIGTGNDGTKYSKDFWEWDQATNIWTRKADFGGKARVGAVGFSIGNKGYIGTGYGFTGTGYGSGTYFKDFWEWDQATNEWKEVPYFGGPARNSAIGVSIGDKGYVGTGLSSSGTNYSFQDFWEMTIQ